MEQLSTKKNAAFTCLVADDSEFARKNISMVVSTIGGRVIGEAANGKEALALYSDLTPDLVLMDITMPELDGIDTLRQIMTKNKDAKVIIVSSLGHKDIIWKAMGLGARSFLTKPYSPEYAILIIKAVIGKEEKT